MFVPLVGMSVRTYVAFMAADTKIHICAAMLLTLQEVVVVV